MAVRLVLAIWCAIGLAGPAIAMPGDTIQGLTAAIEADPDDYDLHQRRAALLVERGDFEGALVDLLASVKANPASRYSPEIAAGMPIQTREHDLIQELEGDLWWIRYICENVYSRARPCPADPAELDRLQAITAAAARPF